MLCDPMRERRRALGVFLLDQAPNILPAGLLDLLHELLGLEQRQQSYRIGVRLLSGLNQQTPHRQIGDLPDGLFIVDDDGLSVVILLVVVVKSLSTSAQDPPLCQSPRRAPAKSIS